MTLVLLLGFMSPAHAVGLNGKGLFCPDASEGYWFKDGIVLKWFFQGYSLETVSQNYYESGPYIVSRECTSTYDLASGDDCTFVFLDKRTLVFKPSGHACELVNYSEELVQQLRAKIGAAKIL